MSKLLEKCALLQFNKHCKEQELLPDYQTAYRENCSCKTTLIKIVNDILWCMENQHVSMLVALDVSAAFNMVDHDILLSVLNKKFGVTGNVYNWFDAYLTSRGCKVNIRNSYSEENLPYCVSQGSVAGPTLYSCYASTCQETENPKPEETGTTENLCEVLQEVIEDLISLYRFADDHSIRKDFKVALNNLEDRTVKQLEECLVRIKKWMDLNWLKMNESKTELILFGSRHQLKKCKTNQTNINGKIVKKSNIIKYLGAFLDELLDLRQYIASKTSEEEGKTG